MNKTLGRTKVGNMTFGGSYLRDQLTSTYEDFKGQNFTIGTLYKPNQRWGIGLTYNTKFIADVNVTEVDRRWTQQPGGFPGFSYNRQKRPLQYENPKLAPTDDWHRVAVAFNTWGYDKVFVSPVVTGGGAGQVWIDDLQLEEIALVNVLRRPGTPLRVRGEASGAVYVEGRDFRYVADPLMDFHFDHPSPAIQLLTGGAIQEGERLRVGFYHSVFLYNDQVPLCLSEPKAYELWNERVRTIEALLAPRAYFLNADEQRALGTCQACKRSGKTLGEIQADSLTRQYRIIRELNPQAEIFVWSDMFDPHHNAGTEKKWYYLTEGSFADSWKHIPKDVNIVCWYFERREASLAHFSSLGFKTMAGAYYDADDLSNPKDWLKSLDATPGAVGILYTTWLDKYELLGAFGDLVSGRR